MPKWKPLVRTYSDEMFSDPEVLLEKGVAFDPEPHRGKRSRLLMEVLRAETKYFVRRFSDGKPTADFVHRIFKNRSCSLFDLRGPASNFVYLVDSEAVKITPSGEWPEFEFTFEYIRLGVRGEYDTHLAHAFSLEPWSSVRVEVMADGSEEKLTMTEYLVE